MMGAWLLPMIGTLASAGASGDAAAPPWRTNRPIAWVRNELYLHAPDPRTAAYLWVSYVGPGSTTEEVLTEEHTSDQFQRPLRRRSGDNGRTWTAFEPLGSVWPYAKDDFIWWAPGWPSFHYDAATRVTVAMWLRQQVVDGRYYNHTFARISRDCGLTWRAPKLLRYEAGDDFAPDQPLKSGFLHNNGAYMGQKVIQRRDGALVYVVCGVRIPSAAPDPNPRGVSVWDTPADSRNIGSLCFIGRWNPTQRDYDWTAGKPVWLPRQVATRGLMEPDVAELRDGRILVVWRGSNDGTSRTKFPGRKWFSVSTDGGATLSPVQ